ncbi:MAG: HAD-IA family hydrolase [Endomicrobiaceae bacterium]|nr:HAD-IA family hydrolase [Endomicrobiaceae bacterium]
MTKKIELVIFDLDGTLVDSKYDLTLAVNFIRQKYGFSDLSPLEVASYLGSGIRRLLDSVLPDIAESEKQDAFLQFNEYYAIHLVDTTVVYDGIIELLEALKDVNKVILSNKTEIYSRKIVENLGLRKYFAKIYGGDTFSEKKPSCLPINSIINEFNTQKEHVCMVGDGVNDVLAGKSAGISTIAVLYGYSSIEKIKSNSPTFIAKNPAEILSYLKK